MTNSASEQLSAEGLAECTCLSALLSLFMDSALMRSVSLSYLLVLRAFFSDTSRGCGSDCSDSSTEDDAIAGGKGLDAVRAKGLQPYQADDAVEDSALAAMVAAPGQGWRRCVGSLPAS